MIKIAICDDKRIFAEKMQRLIDSYCTKKQILYEADLYQSGYELTADPVKMMSYQIVFLDINMKQMDGLETARKFRQLCSHTFLIFVTAFINYTLEGYKVEATRYLLKSDPNFKQAVFEALDAVFQKMNYKPNVRAFQFCEGEGEVVLEKIIYVESNLHKLRFYMAEGEIRLYTMYETLNHVAVFFDHEFIRIHQSYLVNLRYVRKIQGNHLLLSKDISLPIARSKMKDVRRQVALYKGGI